jgi:hypothetical protein
VGVVVTSHEVKEQDRAQYDLHEVKEQDRDQYDLPTSHA